MTSVNTPGQFGAGALLLYREPDGSWSTLLQQRAAGEHEPGTFCIYGGMPEAGEDSVACMIREVEEESGIYVGACPRFYLHGYEEHGGDFVFHTYAVIVNDKAVPVHSVETSDAHWYPLGRTASDLWASLPSPLLIGFEAMTTAPAAVYQLLKIIGTDEAA